MRFYREANTPQKEEEGEKEKGFQRPLLGDRGGRPSGDPASVCNRRRETAFLYPARAFHPAAWFSAPPVAETEHSSSLPPWADCGRLRSLISLLLFLPLLSMTHRDTSFGVTDANGSSRAGPLPHFGPWRPIAVTASGPTLEKAGPVTWKSWCQSFIRSLFIHSFIRALTQ